MTLRRNILVAAASALTIRVAPQAAAYTKARTGAAPAQHSDAELIALCGEYLRVQWEFEAYCVALGRDVESDDPGVAMLDPADGLVDQIVALTAHTLEGITARGRCMAYHFLPKHPACRDDLEGSASDRFQAALLRDLVQMQRMPA
ncbi:hypothetical protein [Acidisphaera sp. L21]|uniref:hypothetical protein n=1 Tax=Acidisphaera sp. L21 TaxID=1641851 RepID=UPI00131B75DA|nr:hypothetical protein [Acidisphaera sp. L21]